VTHKGAVDNDDHWWQVKMVVRMMIMVMTRKYTC